MKISTILNKSFATRIWNPMPAWVQLIISKIYARIYTIAFSSLMIGWFTRRYGLSADKMLAYKPASGKRDYRSFQDFFVRKLALPPKLALNDMVWPCQGHVVEFGKVKEMGLVNVKGQARPVSEIFGRLRSEISESFFVNIFLHNHHYHRFHSPVSGRVAKIERIPGKLSFLRPWFYKKSEVSKPSLINERVVLEIRDLKDKLWRLAIVGGMGVGTIVLNSAIEIDGFLNCGDEIGYFLLGSTICMAIPHGLEGLQYMKSVMALETLPMGPHVVTMADHAR